MEIEAEAAQKGASQATACESIMGKGKVCICFVPVSLCCRTYVFE